MIAVSIDYLTSSDCAVAFKRIAIFPDCITLVHFLDCCIKDCTWTEIHLDHLILLTTKGIDTSNLDSSNLQMRHFAFLERNFKFNWPKKIVSEIY